MYNYWWRMPFVFRNTECKKIIITTIIDYCHKNCIDFRETRPKIKVINPVLNCFQTFDYMENITKKMRQNRGQWRRRSECMDSLDTTNFVNFPSPCLIGEFSATKEGKENFNKINGILSIWESTLPTLIEHK